MVAAKKRKSGLRKGGGKARLPGLRQVQTKIAQHHKKKLPKEPENPVTDDGEFDFDTPPAVLNIHGVKLWRRVVKILRQAGELSSDDWFGLRSLCYIHQQMEKMMQSGLVIPAPMQRNFDNGLQEYGMTPASRVRIGTDAYRRKHGAAPPGVGSPKVFEEQGIPVEGEEKERATKVTGLEDRAASLL